MAKCIKCGNATFKKLLGAAKVTIQGELKERKVCKECGQVQFVKCVVRKKKETR